VRDARRVLSESPDASVIELLQAHRILGLPGLADPGDQGGSPVRPPPEVRVQLCGPDSLVFEFVPAKRHHEGRFNLLNGKKLGDQKRR